MNFVSCNVRGRPNCSICYENFRGTRSNKALGHKDASDRAIHLIHDNCLQKLIQFSLKNANTPPRCPLCREQITHVNGKPVQRVQRPLAAAPMDPLTIDAIDGMPEVFGLAYRHAENQRLLSQRFLQSLIPGRVEHLQRRNLFPERSRSLNAALFIRSRRDITYAVFCSFLVLSGSTLLSLPYNRYDNALVMGIFAVIHAYLVKRALRNLRRSVEGTGAFLFLTEADQE